MGAILFPLRLVLALAVLFVPFRPLRAMALAASGAAALAAFEPQDGAPVQAARTADLLGEVQDAAVEGDFALAAALVAAVPGDDARLAQARPTLVAIALSQVRPLPAADAAGNHAGYAFLAALDPTTPVWADRAAHYAARLP